MLYGARRKVWRYQSDSVITPWHTCARRRGTLNRKSRLCIKERYAPGSGIRYCPNEFSARQDATRIYKKNIATMTSPAWCLRLLRIHITFTCIGCEIGESQVHLRTTSNFADPVTSACSEGDVHRCNCSRRERNFVSDKIDWRFAIM